MKKIAIVALLSAFIAAPAVAADMYVGVNVGQNRYDDSTMSKNTSTAIGILGGHTINENISIEAAYTSLGSLVPDSTYPDETLKGSAISLSGVGSYPVNPQFSLFGKLGIARTTVDFSFMGLTFSGNKTNLAFGFGGQYNVSPAVGIRAGFDRYKVGILDWSADTDVMSVGAVFKF